MNWQTFETHCWFALIFFAFITAISYMVQLTIKLRTKEQGGDGLYLNSFKYSQQAVHHTRWLAFFFVLLGFVSIMQGNNLGLLKGDVGFKIFGINIDTQLIPVNLSLAKVIFVIAAVFSAFIGINCLYLSGTIYFLNRKQDKTTRNIGYFEMWLEFILGVFLILISILWAYYGFALFLHIKDGGVSHQDITLQVHHLAFAKDLALVTFIVGILCLISIFVLLGLTTYKVLKGWGTKNSSTKALSLTKVFHSLVLFGSVILFVLILLAEWQLPMPLHSIWV